MNDGIVFYTNPQSRGRVVQWMLEEVGVPFETKLVSFEKAEHKSPGFLAVNPMGKLPAITHRGVVVTETAAICAYLADAFPAAKLAPALDDPRRGAYLRWLFFSAGSLEYAIVDKMLARPPVERKGTIGYGTYEDALNTLENALSQGPFLLGAEFSAADLCIGSQLAWAMRTNTLESRPAFAKYVQACTSRPAFGRANATNEAHLAALKAEGR